MAGLTRPVPPRGLANFEADASGLNVIAVMVRAITLRAPRGGRFAVCRPCESRPRPWRPNASPLTRHFSEGRL